MAVWCLVVGIGGCIVRILCVYNLQDCEMSCLWREPTAQYSVQCTFRLYLSVSVRSRLRKLCSEMDLQQDEMCVETLKCVSHSNCVSVLYKSKTLYKDKWVMGQPASRRKMRWKITGMPTYVSVCMSVTHVVAWILLSRFWVNTLLVMLINVTLCSLC